MSNDQFGLKPPTLLLPLPRASTFWIHSDSTKKQTTSPSFETTALPAPEVPALLLLHPTAA
jgi:hypothetical protein